jgi:ATP/maltotriose-dependent transcriptional regulator MalT
VRDAAREDRRYIGVSLDPTVESHLDRLFPKLGVISRTQLRGALENASDS